MTSKPAVVGGIVTSIVLVVAAIAVRLEGAAPLRTSTAVILFVILAALAAAAAILFVRANAKLRSLPITFLIAAAATAPLLGSGLLVRFPLIGTLWQRADPSRHIVTLIVFIVFWLMLHLFTHVLNVLAETRVTEHVEKKLQRERGEIDWVALLPSEASARDTVAWLRIDLVLEQKTNPELAARLVAERAHTDDIAMQSAYAPLNALVWALPALGFIGTAAMMARSIRGIGSSIHGQGDSQQQLRALTDVVPNLGDAFNITLIALASTIVCFFVLAVVHAYEEQAMSRLQSLAVRLIGKIKMDWPRTPGVEPIDRLLTEMWSLEVAINKLRGPVAEFVGGNGSALTLAQLLLRTTMELETLNRSAADHAKALMKLTSATRRIKTKAEDGGRDS